MNTNHTLPHRRSVRIAGYDYTRAGAYFVTICTRDRACILGDVVDGTVHLNPLGCAARHEWMVIPTHHPQVVLDVFVVMPNHVHGIIILSHPSGTARRAPTEERFARPVAGSLPTIVRAFKSASTRSINLLRRTPGAAVWQRNYYEHVIRNEDELLRAREYIVNNPLRWSLDRDNPDVIAPRALSVGLRPAVPS
ncbi:MAG: transposase [Candidatus Zixiibacteriota bacterium]